MVAKECGVRSGDASGVLKSLCAVTLVASRELLSRIGTARPDYGAKPVTDMGGQGTAAAPGRNRRPQRRQDGNSPRTTSSMEGITEDDVHNDRTNHEYTRGADC